MSRTLLLRSLLLPIISLCALRSAGQGFPFASVHWSVPAGGITAQGAPYGYMMPSGTTADYHDTGSQNWTTMDMNGDGQPDLVITAQLGADDLIRVFSPNSNSYWKVYLNNGSGFNSTSINWPVPHGGITAQGTPYGYMMPSGTTADYHDTGSENWTTMDVNGDARPDLVITAQLGADDLIRVFSPNSNSYWKVYLNNGSGFNSTSINWPVPHGGITAQGTPYGYMMPSGTTADYHDTGSENWTTMDMNGDGRPDLVITAQLGADDLIRVFSPNSNSYWKVYLNNGSGFNSTSINWPVPHGGITAQGTPYGYMMPSGTTADYHDTGSENWTTMDMNGDARPDLVITAQLGADDLIRVFSPNSNSYWKVYLNNGSGFNSTSATWPVPHGGITAQGTPYGYMMPSGTTADYHDTGSENWTMADMNSDARPDLVITAQLGADDLIRVFSPNSNSYWKVYYNTGSGFNSTSINWSVPHGGITAQGTPYGYMVTSGTTANYHDTGSENWTMMDINGDRAPDLVITAQLGADDLIRVFSPNSNPYWKVYLAQVSTGVADAPAQADAGVLYPNPTAGPLTLLSDEALGAVQLLDAQGQLVRTWRGSGPRMEMDLSDLPMGLYALAWMRNGDRWVQRVAVVR